MVFLPPCGKRLGIGYLASLGHRVVGVEPSELAAQQLFRSLGIAPRVTRCHHACCWQVVRVTVFDGNLFELTPRRWGPLTLICSSTERLGGADAGEAGTLQRADDRYAPGRATTVDSFEYPKPERQGPPFSVAEPKLIRLYGRD